MKRTCSSATEQPPRKCRRRRRSSRAISNEHSSIPQCTNRYPYGNSPINQWPTDERLGLLRKEWFENRDVLDLGCNSGFMTLAIASVFRPSSIIGIDIDRRLINAARKNLEMCQGMSQYQRADSSSASNAGSSERTPKFPISMTHLYGPLFPPKFDDQSTSTASGLGFCRSVNFRVENLVYENDSDLEKVKEKCDTVIALNVTKWIHLNSGDDGLKRFFKRAYAHLRPGGLFVLEPQSWADYKKGLKGSEVKESLQLKPDKFRDYLCGEVGFRSCDVVAFEKNVKKGMIELVHYSFSTLFYLLL